MISPLLLWLLVCAFERGGGKPEPTDHKFRGGNSVNAAFAFIEPTDKGLIEDLTRKVIRDGEKRLMLAVLESATEDFQKYVLATDTRGKQLFQAAEDWILDTDDPSFFSFANICEHLHLDPDYMRRGYMRWKANKLAHQISGCLKAAHRRAS